MKKEEVCGRFLFNKKWNTIVVWLFLRPSLHAPENGSCSGRLRRSALAMLSPSEATERTRYCYADAERSRFLLN